MKPVYRIIGWSRRSDVSQGGCVFSIELDARFAEKARNFNFESQRIFEKDIREIIGYKYARATFLDDTAFLRSMAVEGDCACLGVSGDLLDSDWSNKEVITYNGHNVDSKAQAFDLLTIFTHWIDVVEAITSVRMMNHDTGTRVLYPGSSMNLPELGKVRCTEGAKELNAHVGDIITWEKI